jgi:4-diphosphocytidyl-2-C-methyl-D-erythritol kinase
MKNTILMHAPAKVNLHLDVGLQRPDGYHSLISLFQAVSLYDTICFHTIGGGRGCDIKGDCPVPPEKNIIKKAYELFMNETGLEEGIEVEIRKAIPEGAGLGGGSSDAAATLICLNHLFNLSVPDQKLANLAVKLGSDVLFFCKAEAAIVKGRGDVVQPVVPRSDFSLVIVYPDFRICTADAYRWLDKERRGKDLSGDFGHRFTEEEIIAIYEMGNISTWSFFNSFTPVLGKRFPVFREINDNIRTAGASFTGISGSGSAVFGLFIKSSCAERASVQLKEKYTKVFVVKPLDKKPQCIVK